MAYILSFLVKYQKQKQEQQDEINEEKGHENEIKEKFENLKQANYQNILD